jgi:AcrR family transcriptional regulator
MTDPRQPLRRDAAHNRQKVMEAARKAIAQGRSLSFNGLASEAGVGVGTVYRNFAALDELRAALAGESLNALVETGRRALSMHEPREGLRAFLSGALAAQLKDDAMLHMIDSTSDVTPHIAGLTAELHFTFNSLLVAATESGALQADVAAEDMAAMLCGISHTARLYHDDKRAVIAEKFLSIVMDGLQPMPSGTST